MMFALWAAVTFDRPLSSAYLKADSTIRSEPNTEIGLIEMPDSSRVGESSSSARKARSFSTSAEPFSNSMPAYRSSVFSRTITMSVSGKRVRTPS